MREVCKWFCKSNLILILKEAEKVPEIMLEFKSEDLHLEDCSILNISQVKVIHL